MTKTLTPLTFGFETLEERWFFNHFSASSDDPYLKISKYHQNSLGEESQELYIASYESSDAVWHIAEFYAPWYGLFLFTVFLYHARKLGWEKITLVPVTMNRDIIYQNHLEDFYRFLGFSVIKRSEVCHSVITLMSMDISEQTISTVIQKVEAVLAWHDLSTGIQPTSRASKLEIYTDPFPKG